MESLPADIKEFLSLLVKQCPQIESIWLIGSRVNPTNVPPNDWDFVVFAPTQLLEIIRGHDELKRSNVDLLVVYDGDRFEEPWFIPSEIRLKPKSGSLSKWEWKQISELEAQYTGTKLRPNSKDIDISEKRALRVWPSEHIA
jgi:hypothetical protein